MEEGDRERGYGEKAERNVQKWRFKSKNKKIRTRKRKQLRIGGQLMWSSSGYVCSQLWR